MMSPEEAYKYDSTFRRVVDLMRAHLSVYEITPAELRQAAMLASTMHVAQRVRPLLYTYTKSDLYPKGDWNTLYSYPDGPKKTNTKP